MSIERRRFPRIPLLAEAWLILGEIRVHVKTQDLSRGGLCIELPAQGKLENQAWCGIELKLPSRDRVDLYGQVAWVRARTAGIRFEGVPTEAQVLLDAEIARVLAELESLEGEKTPT